MSAPITPPAPPRLSTTTGCPSDSVSRGARSRASKSVPPPAANGTTKRMGLPGQGWAAAGIPAAQHRRKAEGGRRKERRALVLDPRPSLFGLIASSAILLRPFPGSYRRIDVAVELPDFVDLVLSRRRVIEALAREPAAHDAVQLHHRLGTF